MKLSLAWIFDHIDARWHDQNIDEIVKKFNAITAEIESVTTYNVDLTPFYMAHVQAITDNSCSVLVYEQNEFINLSRRDDAQVNQIYMVKQTGHDYVWATLHDFGGEKAGYLPSFHINTLDAQGPWKDQFERQDIIIEVDNKSITHRPDMWGHRGFAREIAAFLNLPLKHENNFLIKHPLEYHDTVSTASPSFPFALENRAPNLCKQFSSLYVQQCVNQSSNIHRTSRLLKVGARPINGLVDIANYLMLDWSQPVHVYDASQIEGSRLIIRNAQAGELMRSLSDIELTLTPEDLVIADNEKVLCLAGVKGGDAAGTTDTTTSFIFESATFDPGTVRRSALRHKMRTDSSARFEKTLSSEQSIEGVFRFLALLQEDKISASPSSPIIVIGKPQHDRPMITIHHQMIEHRAGIAIPQKAIVESLQRLGFEVVSSCSSEGSMTYTITVPHHRASKDITLPEDIFEEIIRSYGYEKIPLTLPCISRPAFPLQDLMALRTIKNFLSYGAQMTEQQNYSFFDESFLESIDLQQKSSIELINPVSDNMKRMVSSLIPTLLKNIRDNHIHRDHLAFYECGRIWNHDASETKSLAGITIDKDASRSFFVIKQHITTLFKILGFSPSDILWTHPDKSFDKPWALNHKTAIIQYHQYELGYIAVVSPIMLDKLGLYHASGIAFELNLSTIISIQPHTPRRMVPLSKFQDSYFDLSILVPLNLTAHNFISTIKDLDDLIVNVELIDVFEHASWSDVRSLTIRCWINHPEKTLSKEEIDLVRNSVITFTQSQGARLRT